MWWAPASLTNRSFKGMAPQRATLIATRGAKATRILATDSLLWAGDRMASVRGLERGPLKPPLAFPGSSRNPILRLACQLP